MSWHFLGKLRNWLYPRVEIESTTSYKPRKRSKKTKKVYKCYACGINYKQYAWLWRHLWKKHQLKARIQDL